MRETSNVDAIMHIKLKIKINTYYFLKETTDAF